MKKMILTYLPFQYVRYIGLGLAAAFVLGAGFFGYRWHVQRREANAQLIFSQAFEEFQQASEQDTVSAWSSAADALHVGYQKAAGAGLAPYLLSFQADALAKQEKLTEALELMDAMLQKLSTSSPLYHLFSIKRALMQIDTGDDVLVQQGLDALRNASQDAGTYHAEVAAYFLGAYYASIDEYQQAEVAWRELVNAVEPEYAKTSPWVTLAEARLKTL